MRSYTLKFHLGLIAFEIRLVSFILLEHSLTSLNTDELNSTSYYHSFRQFFKYQVYQEQKSSNPAI